MAVVYTIKPSETMWGSTLSHIDPGLPTLVQSLMIERIEVRTYAGEWVVYLAGGEWTEEGLGLLEERLRRDVPGLQRVRWVVPGLAATAAHLPEPAALPPRDRETAAPDTTESDEAYMSQILARARDFARLSDGGAGAAPASGSGGRGRSERTSQKPSDPDGEARVLLGRDIAQEAVPMVQVTDEERQVVLQGVIFNLEVRDLRSRRRIVGFDFTDRTSSFSAKVFEEEDGRLAQTLSKGMHVRCRGPAQFDKFTQELTLFPRDIVVLPPLVDRVDLAAEKRVELHLHTKMSALDGAADIGQVVAQAAAWGHRAVAITDHGVVQAFPEAFAAAKKAGIKLILGMEGYLCETEAKESRLYHIILLAKNQSGLVNLYRLVSLSHIEYFYRRPRIPRAELIKYREGLILGSACEAGELYQAILNGEPDARVEEIAAFYDYLEIQPLANTQFLVDEGRVPDEEGLKAINRRIYELGLKLGKPVVATGDVHFLHPDDHIFRQVIMASHGFTDLERPTPLHFRTTDEMLAEFAYLGAEAARAVVIEGPAWVERQVESVRPVPDGFFPPHLEGAEEKVRQMCQERSREWYGDPLPVPVAERLERELNSIIGNGFASLYLIAHKLVKKSVDDGYYVGSRGSVGSSFVALLMGITEVNPLPPHYTCPQCHHFEMVDDPQWAAGPDLPLRNCPACGVAMRRDGFDIPFETFLGFDGDKVPDIDLNFSGEYQPVAHRYTEELFGADSVFRAGTVGTLAEKTAYGYVKKYLDEKGIRANTAEINRLVQGCTGVRRTTGQHPGGLLVVPEGREIYEFTPVQFPANDKESGTITTHYEYKSALDGVLVKLDILGHDGPTVIRMLEQLTGRKAADIPLDDPDTMAIFSGLGKLGIGPEVAGGEIGTLGIPEFNTPFVRQMLFDTRPKSFADLVRIMGLSHGTDVWLNNAQELIRSGVITLAECIACRDDIMIHLIRQGLEPLTAFKIMEDVRRGRGLKPEYEEAMRAHGVPKWYIESCNKIGYMFPKAHAVAYAIMAFWQAYYKVHYPVAFYAAHFTVKAEDFDADLVVKGPKAVRRTMDSIGAKGVDATAKEKSAFAVLEVVLEAMGRGVEFLPVDLYASDAVRFLVEENRLRPPLIGIQGLGAAAAGNVVVSRAERPFTSVTDLRKRAGLSKSVIDVLQQHGCLTGLPESDQLTLF